MDSTAHASNALIFNLVIFYLIWHNLAPPIYQFWALFFGIFPDFDVILFRLKGQDPTSNNFQHHLYFGSHWPITYSPLIFLMILSFIFNCCTEISLTIVVGIYAHFICDSACCGDGIMWLKTFNKKKFAPFINLFSSRTDGYHGNYWTVRWRRTLMFKIAVFEALSLISFQIYQMFHFGFSAYNLLIMLALFGALYASFIPVDPKFNEEPPNGRYDDYRRNKDYLRWMEENGYTFNEKMHVVKVKRA